MVLFLFPFRCSLYIIARWDEGKEERARRTLKNNIIFEIMKEIQIFNNNNFGKLRVIVKEGKVWFCLADACKALEIRNPRDVKKRLDSGGVDTIDAPTPSKNQHGEFTYTQTFTFINEANLYRCIFQSKKEEAKQYQDWVFNVVLPQITKTGGYIPVTAEDDEKTILCRAIQILKRTVEEKDALLEKQEPKVQFANAITASNGEILVRELAKLLTQNGIAIGQDRLFGWLRHHGYLFKRDTSPIQEWVEKGIFSTHVTLIATNHGTIERITTYVTGKGQQYFVDGFLSGRFSFSDDQS